MAIIDHVAMNVITCVTHSGKGHTVRCLRLDGSLSQGLTGLCTGRSATDVRSFLGMHLKSFPLLPSCRYATGQGDSGVALFALFWK